jgi:hypothetical protein
MFRRKNRLLRVLFLPLFEGHLMKYCEGFKYKYINPHGALAEAVRGLIPFLRGDVGGMTAELANSDTLHGENGQTSSHWDAADCSCSRRQRYMSRVPREF